jgi:glycosyltransferase involved in cell wall biosynthesis
MPSLDTANCAPSDSDGSSAGAAVAPRARTFESIAIAAPAYNEAAGIERFVRDWQEALGALPGLALAEIVICNDGSRDTTGALLETLARECPALSPVHHEKNRGAGRAMATAIANTRAAWVLLLDADGQFPPACLDDFEAALAERPDARALLGERRRKHDSAFARAGARLTTATLNALYGTRYHDLSSACQLVRGDLLRALPLEAKGLNYSVEISARLLEAGIRPVPVSIEHRGRERGRSARTLLQSTFDRAAFVGYFAVRRALLAAGVIAARPAEDARCASR